MATSTGGGCRGVATVNGSGNLTNIAVDRPGQGYVSGDTVRIIDVSGPGEGAYANVVTDRSVAAVTVNSAGSGYSADTQVIAIDNTGHPVLDLSGNEIDRTYGSGAILRPVLTTEASCSD